MNIEFKEDPGENKYCITWSWGNEHYSIMVYFNYEYYWWLFTLKNFGGYNYTMDCRNYRKYHNLNNLPKEKELAFKLAIEDLKEMIELMKIDFFPKSGG